MILSQTKYETVYVILLSVFKPHTPCTHETIQSLHDKLALMGAHALIECLELFKNKLLPAPMIQDEKSVIYAHKLKKSEANVSWHETAEQINCKTRAFNPWPGVVVEIAGETYKIWQSSIVSIESKVDVGQIVKANKNSLVIQCKNSQLEINIIQKPGKKQMPINQFMASKTTWFT